VSPVLRHEFRRKVQREISRPKVYWRVLAPFLIAAIPTV
jgi:hypothetical protein